MNYLADRYADFIVHSMLRLEEGEKLTVHANSETVEFAHRVAHEAAESTGVSVALVYIENGKVESVDEIEPSYSAGDARGNVMLNLASFTPSVYRSDDELDAVHLQMHRLLADPVFLDRRIGIPYAVAYVPTASWAEFVYGSGATTDQLYLDLADYLGIEDGDAAARTQARVLELRCRELNELDIRSVELEIGRTRLSARLAEGARIGSSAVRLPGGRTFYPTFPAEDIIFPLDYRHADGTIVSSYPFRFFDRVIQGAEITVKDGRITSFSCDAPQLAQAYVNIDTMAGMAGELVLCDSMTPSSRFDLAFGIPLLDRMRTSCMVFGGVSPELVTLEDEAQLDACGLNTSFARLEVPFGGRDLNVSALTGDGRRVQIYKDGLFSLGI